MRGSVVDVAFSDHLPNLNGELRAGPHGHIVVKTATHLDQQWCGFYRPAIDIRSARWSGPSRASRRAGAKVADYHLASQRDL